VMTDQAHGPGRLLHQLRAPLRVAWNHGRSYEALTQPSQVT
jgi:hypothetical protein